MSYGLTLACKSCLSDFTACDRGAGITRATCDYCGQIGLDCTEVENVVRRPAGATRALKFKEIRDDEKPLSEQFRLAGEAWAAADGAASLMENLKSVTLDQRKAQLILDRGDMPDNKAERIAKSAPDWEEYIRQMVKLRMEANRLKVEMEFVRYRFSEWQSRDANQRHEARLSR